MRQVFIFFLLFHLPVYINAQYQLTGYVVEESGEALIGANVFSKNDNVGATTNEYGYFSLTLSSQNNTLSVSYIGFDTRDTTLILSKDIGLTIELIKNNLLQEVVVKEKREDEFSNSRLTLPVETLNQIPTIACETDIFKSLSLFPGISTAQEGSSSLFIRGGTPDQNLILLDGVPVYNATHLGGFFSVFNSDALKKVDVYKGNFPARYGGRLSSVIDIQTKEGNQKETHGNIGLGIITSRFSIEGPINDHANYFVAARTSYFGLLNLFTDKEKVDNYFDYWLYDINAKVNMRLRKGRLFFSSYFGNDVGANKSKSISAQSDAQVLGRKINTNEIQWGNVTLSSRYVYPLTSKLYSKFLVGYSQYKYRYQLTDVTESYSIQDTSRTLSYFRNFSTVRDKFIVSNWDLALSSSNQVKFGAGLTFHHFTTGSIDTSANFDRYRNFLSKEIFAFAENKLSLTKRLSFNLGLRWSSLLVEKQSYSNFEPRLSLSYRPNNSFDVSAFFTKNNQYIHLLSNNGFGFPNNIWIPATKNTPPQNAIQFGIGSGLQFCQNYHVGMEWYYRRMSNLINYKSGVDPDEPPIFDWEKIITKEGLGVAYGSEILVEKEKGRLTGFVSYTLAWNFRQFAQLNQGKVFYHSYDRRHDFSILGSYRFGTHWSISANWIFQTGSAVSLPVGAITVPGGAYAEPIFEGRNAGRMPNYHRLDLGAEYVKTTKHNNHLKAKFSIYNAYNRRNPSYLFIHEKAIYDKDLNPIKTEKSIRQVSLFFFTPSASIEYKF